MIFQGSNWGKTEYLLNKAMDVEVFRRKVIADNIANVDVPHFKRSEVSFEAELRRILNLEKYIEKNEVPAKMSHARHIPFFRKVDYKDARPRAHVDYLSTMRNDGNNVDMEHEMSLATENQLRFQALSSLTQSHYRNMYLVLRSA